MTNPTNTVPTTANRGMLPAGTILPIWGEIIRQSDTAYAFKCEGEELWVSFDRVHGKPEPVMPLVRLG